MSYTQRLTKRSVRRSLALTATGAMIFALTPLQAATADVSDICPPPGESETDSFADDETSVHEDNINCAAAYGYVNGTTATTFDPNGDLTRGQAASLLVQWAEVATGAALTEDGTDNFSDDDTSVHEENINKAADNGLISGFADGTFKPNETISRAQFATIAVQATEFVLGSDLTEDGTDNFSDDDTSVHEDNINKAADNGIVGGVGGGEFNPGGDVTRGQTATISVQAAGEVLQPAGKWDPAVPAGQTGVITAFDAGADTYTFSTADGKSVTASYDATNDKFMVDGSAASLAAFESNLSVGDEVRFVDDAATTAVADADEHHLTNKSAASYTSGMVGNVDTSADTFYIIDKTSGVALSDVKTYTSSIYFVDGAVSTLASFENDINEGDSITIETDAASNKTFKLTNAKQSGTVKGLVKAGLTPNQTATFKVGALGDVATGAADTDYVAEETPAGHTEVYTVDGVTKTFADFNTALNDGDTLAYSRKGNAETFELTNVAPSAQSGTAADGGAQAKALGAAGGSFTMVNGTSDIAVTYDATTAFLVDNQVVTEAEWEAAYTAGDSIAWTPDNPDTTSVDEARLALTNAALKGSIPTASIDTAANTYDVANAEGNIIFDDLDYTASAFTAAGVDRYFVNGTERNLADWESFLTKVKADTTPDESIEVVRNGTLSTDHKLTTDETI